MVTTLHTLRAAGRACLAPAAAGALLFAGFAQADPAAAQAAPIDRNGVIILLRSTLIALDQANKTGNYTVLRDLGAASFRVHSAAQLAETFGPHRRDRLDLSGVAVLEPQISAAPTIGADGVMRFEGFFPSAPSQVTFNIAFAPEDRQWRLAGLSLRLTPSGPQAPERRPPAPAAGAPAAPAPAPAAPAPAAKPPQPPAR